MLQEVAKEVRLVADTLNFVREVTVVINDSAKRKTLYQSFFGCGEVINLLALCPTRRPCGQDQAVRRALQLKASSSSAHEQDPSAFSPYSGGGGTGVGEHRG